MVSCFHACVCTSLPASGTPAVLVVRPPTDDDHHIGFFLRKGFTSGTKKTFAGYKERCAVVVQDTHASTETFYLLVRGCSLSLPPPLVALYVCDTPLVLRPSRMAAPSPLSGFSFTQSAK